MPSQVPPLLPQSTEVMSEDETPPEDGRKIAWAIGAAALAAWFLVLWLMFGDVL